MENTIHDLIIEVLAKKHIHRANEASGIKMMLLEKNSEQLTKDESKMKNDFEAEFVSVYVLKHIWLDDSLFPIERLLLIEIFNSNRDVYSLIDISNDVEMVLYLSKRLLLSIDGVLCVMFDLKRRGYLK